MKNLMVLLVMLPMTLLAAPDFTGISRAISKGDVAQLSSYFDEMVEVTVMGNGDMYDKGEAKNVVSKFFSSNKVSSYELVHQGTAKNNGSHYCIGNMVSGGNQYRVYLYLKDVGGKFLIQEIRFEK